MASLRCYEVIRFAYPSGVGIEATPAMGKTLSTSGRRE